MITKKNVNWTGQQGVALLFALGILSMLLILGLAFVANSLLAQKVAANNSNRSQAKMLAQSGISRMVISLMYYQELVAEKGYSVKDYSDVYSVGDPDTSSDAKKDGLLGEKSKLIPSGMASRYDVDTDLHGEWIYFTAKEDIDSSITQDKIIGRIAYQMLPAARTSNINMEHLLRGVYDFDEPGNPDGTTDTTPDRRIPWDIRWGFDINELNLDASDVLKKWQTKHAPKNEAEFKAKTYAAFFEAYGGKSETGGDPPLFSASDPDLVEKKAWIKRWLAEGSVPAEPEVYSYQADNVDGQVRQDIKTYHRFNLGKIDDIAPTEDIWYARFDTADKNNTQAVENLTAESEPFRANDSLTPLGVGLPFLKLIGSSPGTFGNIADRRRQIAANLNDYCDSDSVPTSDVEAEDWKNRLSTDDPEGETAPWPKFTGNEKTPYINEFAFGFNINPTVVDPNLPTMKIKADVKAELAAELISIYEETPSDPYTLYVNLPASGFTFNLEVKAKIKITYKATETSPQEETTVTAGKTFPIKLATGTEESPVSDIREIVFATDPDSDSDLWKSGYAVNHLNLSLSDSTVELSGDENGVISNVVDGKYSSSVELTHVSFAVKSFDFKVQGMTLTKQESVGAATKEVGVDFVRWDKSYTSPEISLFQNVAGYQASGENAGFIVINAGEETGGETGGETGEETGGETGKLVDVKDQKIYLAGMQARDPRQNLNVKENLKGDGYDEDASDWRTFSDINWIYNTKEDTYDKGLLSMEIKFNADTVGNSFVQGLVNGVSNPSDKEKKKESDGITETVVGDNEEVADPAWSDDDSDHHLSTAYIRNAPMKSLWELGAIHRAKAWQTINLKSAAKPGDISSPVDREDMIQDPGWDGDGTTYEGGDGGILEQVKLQDKAYSYGKVDVNMLCDSDSINPDFTWRDLEIGNAIFYKLKIGQDLVKCENLSFNTTGNELIPSSCTIEKVGDKKTKISTTPPGASLIKATDRPFDNRAQFLDWNDGTEEICSLANGFGLIPSATYNNLTDAAREEIVGKTINLLKADTTPPTYIQFVVVAQTIRDLEGEIVRFDSEGKPFAPHTSQFGVFDVKADSEKSENDPDKYAYYDEITGEVKLLVSVENNPVTKQIVIRQIEYID